MLAGVERVSTTEQAVSILREAIVRGQLEQGAQLREEPTARALGISRSSLREALRQLIQEGLIEYRIHRGAFVKRISPDNIVEIYAAREAIETMAVRLLVEAPSPPRLEPVEARLAELVREACGDGRPSPALVAADVALHAEIVALTGNAYLLRMFSTLAAETRMYLHLHGEYPSQSYVEIHETLLDALRRRLPGAEELFRSHLRESQEQVLATLPRPA